LPEAQNKFIRMLKVVVGLEYVGNLPILLRSNYLRNDYPDNIKKLIEDMLNSFNSTGDFSNQSPKIDCFIINHPVLKTRIVEFDEEQHFSPFRFESIRTLSNIYTPRFANQYINLSDNNNVAERMLHKCRLNANVLISKNSNSLLEYIQQNFNSNNNYIRQSPGFNYKGGRMVQRAYFDFLKDIAHINNPELEPILRFSIFEFEFDAGVSFMHIPDEQLSQMIKKRLIAEL